ncbi:hypothetical protein J8273_8660 [Carpediemonas membranifera]|uniref:Uncharacterized protein n=1 Tax=Carpediemonas membranifera TaxID=201153 RepID=A0A8J6AZX1_9EUKA|nr:hypothetical protein J8273_8660 [Carpediemonas membranifera]|eukprot:KAG9389972.1 hypothetical protein J8273_8660 [Carpediemonas membranifera]
MGTLERILLRADAKNLTLRCLHIAGHLNVQPDRLSRFARLEWATPRGVLENIAKRWGPPQVDATARPDKTLALPGFVSQAWTREEHGLSRDWRGMRVFMAPPLALIGQISRRIQSIREQTQSGSPLTWTSAVIIVTPDHSSPEMRTLKRLSRHKAYYSVPANQYADSELSWLEKNDKIRLMAMVVRTTSRPSDEDSRRAAAGWVCKLLRERDRTLPDNEQLKQYLSREAGTCGPASITRKGYWICEAAPLISDWKLPLAARQIIIGASNRASLQGLTGGARPVTSAEVQRVTKTWRTSPRHFQVVLFSTLCFMTAARGAEIFNLTKGDIQFDPEGNAVLRINRTKTETGTRKLIVNRMVCDFNPARALKLWIATATRRDGDSLWRRVRKDKVSLM